MPSVQKNAQAILTTALIQPNNNLPAEIITHIISYLTGPYLEILENLEGVTPEKKTSVTTLQAYHLFIGSKWDEYSLSQRQIKFYEIGFCDSQGNYSRQPILKDSLLFEYLEKVNDLSQGITRDPTLLEFIVGTIKLFKGRIQHPLQNVSRLARVNKSYNRFFKGAIKENDLKQQAFNALLQHMVRGEQKQVVAILKGNSEFMLSHWRGDVTDLSGRTFKHITACQCAAWPWNIYVLKGMLDCIPKDQEVIYCTDLLHQLNALKKMTYVLDNLQFCGLRILRSSASERERTHAQYFNSYFLIIADHSYTLGFCNDKNEYIQKTLDQDSQLKRYLSSFDQYTGSIIRNNTILALAKTEIIALGGQVDILKQEPHFSFKPSINRLRELIFDCKDWPSEEQAWYWCNAFGLMQRSWPANGIQAWFRHDSVSRASFDAETLPREEVDWTGRPALPFPDSLGSQAAYLRGENTTVLIANVATHLEQVKINLEKLENLSLQRRQNIADFKEEMLSRVNRSHGCSLL